MDSDSVKPLIKPAVRHHRSSSSPISPSPAITDLRRQGMPRRKLSLRMPMHAPTDVPVPPSLIHTPYASTPTRTAQRELEHLPNQEAEEWLQDTVPLGSTSSVGTCGGSPSSRNEGSANGHRRRGHPASPPLRAQTVCGLPAEVGDSGNGVDVHFRVLHGLPVGGQCNGDLQGYTLCGHPPSPSPSYRNNWRKSVKAMLPLKAVSPQPQRPPIHYPKSMA